MADRLESKLNSDELQVFFQAKNHLLAKAPSVRWFEVVA